MASGDILAVWEAADNHYDSTNPATLVYDSGKWVLAFDATTDELAEFSDYLDTRYTSGGLTFTLHVSMASATTGNVIFQVNIRSQGSGDAASRAFVGANASSATAVAGTAGNIFLVTVTFTNGADMDSLATGEGFDIQVNRDADDTTGTDSATGDAYLRKIVMTET